MPAVVDISNSRSTKKSPGKPKPKPGPKPGLLIGVIAALVLSAGFLVWFFMLRGGADAKEAAPYGPSVRGANGGGAGSTAPTRSKVAPGLPGDGG